MRVALILVALAGVAHATPSEDFDKARQAFRSGQFDDARKELNDLLYPKPKLARPDELAEAYVALGVCRFETGDTTGARVEFEHALALDPGRLLDPFVVTNRDAIQLFDDTKAEIKLRADQEAVRKHKAELRKLRDSIIGYESHSFALNFAPFGVGQFQNHDTAKGVALLATESATFGLSAGIWTYLVDRYGIRSTRVPLADGPGVRTLQQIEIASGVAFFGLWILGGVDAYRHYKPQVRGELDESVLPPELRELDKEDRAKNRPAKPAPKPTSLLEHIVPIITQNGGGIGLAWEND